MATKVYGCSDDLIEFDGDIHGEVGCFGTDESDHGVLMYFSDGTIIEGKYGKLDQGIWEMKLHNAGSLFQKIDPCTDAEAKIYSDIAHFAPGLKWAYAAKEWERVK